MLDKKLETLSFGAMVLSLFFVLVYLALAVESARAAGAFWADSRLAATLVAQCSMKSLLLTVLMGLGLDWYMKKRQ